MKFTKNLQVVMWKVIYNEFRKFYPLPDYDSVVIQVNDKMTSTAGLTYPDFRIKLSAHLIHDVPTLYHVLVHELGHLHLFYKFGNDRSIQPHGTQFKDIINFFNYHYPRLPKLSVHHDYPLKYNYELVCKPCNAILNKYVKKPYINGRVHAKCGGELFFRALKQVGWDCHIILLTLNFIFSMIKICPHILGNG